jgi:hypothetical protein
MNETDEKKPETILYFKNCYGSYRISVPADDMPLGRVIVALVIPVLTAAGYSSKLIDEFIPPEGLGGE